MESSIPLVSKLPDPISHIILELVAPSDIVTIATTCRHWRRVTHKWAAVRDISCSEDHTRLLFLLNFVMSQSVQSLRSVSITKIDICDSEMPVLATALQRCTNLQTLDLSYTRFTARDTSVLASVLPHLPNLTSLILSDAIARDTLSVLAPALRHCSNLEMFEASQTPNFSQETLTATLEWLSCAPNLNHFSLTNRLFKFDGCMMPLDMEGSLCGVLAMHNMRHLQMNIRSGRHMSYP